LQNEREAGVDFVEKKFAEYYAGASAFLSPPSGFLQREFGFIPFTGKIMIRHKGFRAPDDLMAFLASLSPAHAYYSAAYYDDPEAPMAKKGWRGSDLIFDIDSDHLPTACTRPHDYWICEDCATGTTQSIHGTCPHCGGSRLRTEFWLCDTCLALAKAEALKLLDFLMDDFGFQNQDIQTCFSGHRGYHVHVASEGVQSLDQGARKEITDYLLGTGLSLPSHGLPQTRRAAEWRATSPTLADAGWRGRIAKGVYDVLLSATPQQLEALAGLSKAIAGHVITNRDRILVDDGASGLWGAVPGVGPKTWEALALTGVQRQAALIDPVVTMDVHRLIRLPRSLHGKTGLQVVPLPVSALEKFDPLQEAIAFPEGRVDVYVADAPAFRLGNAVYGPYRRERVELPMAAGVYLLCKRAAADPQLPP